jgi:hypothetical protein
MKYTIYKITNKIDDKIYIGKHQTNNLDDGYMGSGKILRRAQSKHGLENFMKKILHVFDTEEEMNAKEKELVTEEFCLREDTYNLCVGGQGGFSYLNRNGLNLYGRNGNDGYGAENLRAASKRHRERFTRDPEYAFQYKEAIRAGVKAHYERNGGVGTFRGKIHTEETKRLIGVKNSKAQQGSKNSQFGSVWITNGTENKKIKSVDLIPEGWFKGRKIGLLLNRHVRGHG